MRLTDLLGHAVVDVDGTKVGTIHDVRLVQDGPLIGTWGAALRLEDLVVGRRSVATRLGYDHGTVRGPWLLNKALSQGGLHHIPWSAVAKLENGVVTLSRRLSELEQHE